MTERRNDPKMLRLTLETKLPTDDAIEESNDVDDDVVVDRDEEEESSRPSELPSEKQMD
jgi:hypothetical protein